ncbi:MAG: hypothetical protein ABSB12_01995 [Candidatus Saccharimonadales bacterium]|jgi:hypothetical protein
MTQGAYELSLGELVAKEDWIVYTATFIAANAETRVGRIEYDTALRACRFASLWIDEFKSITGDSGKDTEGGPKAVIELAMERALAKAQGINRYPTGIPSLKTIIASWYAFTLSFPAEERTQVWEILTRPEES